MVDDPEVVGERVGLLEVLRREEHGHSAVARQARNLVPERRAALDVEAGRGLVQEQDPGAVDEGQREVEPALHATRVAADPAVGRLPQPHPGEQLVAPLRSLWLREPVQSALEPHVLAAREVGVERRLLERRADRVAHRGPLANDVVAGDPRGPGGGGQERGQHVHGGRLAGAVRAQEAVDLARPHLEVDAVDRPRAVLEFADEALDLDALVRTHPASFPRIGMSVEAHDG